MSSGEEEDRFNGEEEDEGECPPYGLMEYWDERYGVVNEQFDWYQTWDTIYPHISKLFLGGEVVLNIGCGNSTMSADMAKVFEKVVSIDFSAVVIRQMAERYSENKKLEWFTMDCTDMTFEDEQFDFAFDKGTLDAIMCGEDSKINIELALLEIYRVLTDGGVFVEISYGTPESRLPLFRSFDFNWDVYDPIEIENPDRPGSPHYIYLFAKGLE